MIPAPQIRIESGHAIRVMIVDDSAVIRGLVTRGLEADPGIRVVHSVGNGKAAVEAIERQPVDVVILDIEMPIMDGITALPKLLAASPGVKIIMASTLTLRNAQISVQALAAGASDYLPKPTSTTEIAGAATFRQELLAKVRALGGAGGRVATRERHVALAPVPGPIKLIAPSRVPAGVIAIGSSTGGPEALFQVLSALPTSVQAPILITQHMPATFTTILAEHIQRQSKRPAAEAVDGEIVKPGRVYVAPGGFHLLVVAQGGEKVLRISSDPPENFCRPAVDPMLRSVARVYGAAALAVILTGMGSDGAKGGEAVARAGGSMIAQDEATSVVWGMPGAAAATGACCAVVPITEIAGQIAKLAGRAGA